MTDCQGRPSQWANPYFYFDYDYNSAYTLFSEYLRARADLREWLFPLRNCELICDCNRGEYCHGNLLVEAFEECFDHDPEDTDADMKLDAMDAACVLEGFDEDDDNDDDIAPALKFNPDIEAINETVRSGAARLHEERPAWLPSWLRLIFIIRNAPHPVFWEMFAGKAGLTREFLRQGWPCGPPVDIVYNPDFDLLNPLFLCVVLGFIFERLVRLLHLPPRAVPFLWPLTGLRATRCEALTSQRASKTFPRIGRRRYASGMRSQKLHPAWLRLKRRPEISGCWSSRRRV